MLTVQTTPKLKEAWLLSTPQSQCHCSFHVMQPQFNDNGWASVYGKTYQVLPITAQESWSEIRIVC